MKKIVIDSNGYLRLLLNDIPEQADQIEKLLKQAKKGEIQVILPQIIIFEILFILEKYYHLSKQDALNKVESLVSIGYVHVESKETFLESISLYRDTSVSFVDCFISTAAQECGAEFFTFDKKLKRLQ